MFGGERGGVERRHDARLGADPAPGVLREGRRNAGRLDRRHLHGRAILEVFHPQRVRETPHGVFRCRVGAEIRDRDVGIDRADVDKPAAAVAVAEMLDGGKRAVDCTPVVRLEDLPVLVEGEGR